jgi:hypothetical protein
MINATNKFLVLNDRTFDFGENTKDKIWKFQKNLILID